MQKLAKRTLAFLLVVSMLCGMMVMTASAITATPESDGSYYYDFTVASHNVVDGVVETAMPWISYTEETNTAKFISGWGERCLFTNLTEPQRAIWESYYNKGMWSTTVPEDATTVPEKQPTGKITYTANLTWLPLISSNGSNLATIGGYSSTRDNPSYRGYDGLQFIPRKAGTSNAKTNEWIALQLKAPAVGKYSVELDYTMLSNGGKSAALYLLPGAATAEQIEAAIANDTGKLGSVDFSGSGWNRDKNIALNDIVCDTPAEAYTLVLRSELNKEGTTAEGVEARAVIDGLRLTPVAENYGEASNVVYDFRVANAPNSTIAAGTQLSSGGMANIVATVDEALNTMYANEQINWDFAGATSTGRMDFNADYAQFYTLGKNASAINSTYVAFKLRSPGEGQYTLDMTGYVASVKSNDGLGTHTAHLWLYAYLVKADSTKTYAEQFEDAKAAGFNGEFTPTYKANRTSSERYDTETLLTYDFEEGAEYILFLKRHDQADMTSNEAANTNYSPNHLYIQTITAVPVPPVVATIGEDVIPPADVSYDFNLYAQNSATFPDQTQLIDLKDEISKQYAINGWDYLGSTAANNKRVYSTAKGLEFNGMGTVAKPNYAAFKLKAPGAGEYTLDFTTYIAGRFSEYKDKEGNVLNTADLYAHLWMNVYLVKVDPSMTYEEQWAVVSAGEPTGEYTPEYKTRAATGIVTEDAACVSFVFEEGAEYILFLARHQDADTDNKAVEGNEDASRKYSPNNIYLSAITAKSTVEAVTAEKCTTLTEAIDKAEAGETIKLQSNILLSSVSVPENVTLDLNGYKLTTSAFTTFEGGKIIDSVGTGLLNVLADGVTFEGNNPLAENTLPIYDAANTGYRFFEYSYSAWGADDDAQYKDREEGGVEGAVRFWYQLNFADAKAYELIAAGNSGVQLGIDVNLNGEVIQKCNFKYADESESTWMQDWASLKADGEAKWLWVRIQNAAGVEGLSITPVISAGGLKDIELAEIPSVQQ